MEMSGRSALKYIDARLKEGVPKHAIYRELLEKIPFKQDVLTYIGMCPDVSAREKLKTANNVLFALVIVTFFIEVFFTYIFFKNLRREYVFELFMPIVWFPVMAYLLLAFAIFVRRFRVLFYRQFGMFFLIFLVMTFEAFGDVVSWSVLNVPLLAAAFLSFYISRKAFPYYKYFIKPEMEKFELSLIEAEKLAAENISSISLPVSL